MTITVLHGDCRSVLPTLAPESVNCVVTSPPYYGLRDYGVAGQIGQEQTPDAYVAEMVAVFRECRRVLRKDGVAWVNLGDSFAGGPIGRNDTGPEALARRAAKYGTGTGAGSTVGASGTRPKVNGLKPKDLIGIPWMVAFALRVDGWYLRSDVIWHKPNPMPESVTDRPTKAHECVFLLTRSERYWYDADAIAEEATGEAPGNTKPTKSGRAFRDGEQKHRTSSNLHTIGARETRNARSVWTIATQPFSGAHFATMPPLLAERCIKAGCPAGGMVLDPFGGAGTTALVADRLGRNATIIELNPAYADMARDRIRGDAPLLAEIDAA